MDDSDDDDAATAGSMLFCSTTVRDCEDAGEDAMAAAVAAVGSACWPLTSTDLEHKNNIMKHVIEDQWTVSISSTVGKG